MNKECKTGGVLVAVPPWAAMISAWAMVVLMVAVAQFTGEKEIIFPEIAALVIGGWVAERQPWEVDRPKQIVLMAICSFMGIAMVRYAPFSLLTEVLVAFALASALLIIFRCTFLPILSACILPILLQVESVVYPVSVILMVLIVAGVQAGLERRHIRLPRAHAPCRYDYRWELRRFLLLLATLAAVGAVAIGTGWNFMIAPPLIVGMAELADPESPCHTRWPRVYALVALCAVTGGWGRWLLQGVLGLSAIPAAAIIMALVLALVVLLRTPFPPAGAIALLPFLLADKALALYPVQVVVGFTVLMAAALGICRLGLRRLEKTAVSRN